MYLYVLIFVLFVLCFCIVSFMYIIFFSVLVYGLLPLSENSMALSSSSNNNNNNGTLYIACITSSKAPCPNQMTVE